MQILEKKENLYDLMEVSPKGYTQSQLKKNYYNLSKVYHPDKNPDPDAHEKFRLIRLGWQF